jgi:hypothetical protein
MPIILLLGLGVLAFALFESSQAQAGQQPGVVPPPSPVPPGGVSPSPGVPGVPGIPGVPGGVPGGIPGGVPTTPPPSPPTMDPCSDPTGNSLPEPLKTQFMTFMSDPIGNIGLADDIISQLNALGGSCTTIANAVQQARDAAAALGGVANYYTPTAQYRTLGRRIGYHPYYGYYNY